MVDALVEACVEPTVSGACETQTQTVSVNSPSNDHQSITVNKYDDWVTLTFDLAFRSAICSAKPAKVRT